MIEDYDWSQFHVRMYYPASIDDVFRHFSTASGLASFFIYRAEHRCADGTSRGENETVVPGDAYHWEYLHHFEHSGEFLDVQKNQLISFTFGAMVVTVRFRLVNEATEVDLHQTGCAITDPERAWQHVNCRSCWIYFMTNLRSVLAGGPDVRDFQHPNWNDSVGIGFDPAADPGIPRTLLSPK